MGKSTLLNALLKKRVALSANYPFTAIVLYIPNLKYRAFYL
ncbi:MAG: 50S ribosome-binding GTPase [Patescibacteria group bacterium]|nr:50S ribosome-binding GTPase [Patescibacteria group bacterium]